MEINTVKKYCEECQAQYRKDRYKIMENYFDIPGETIKDIISFDRYLRDILQVDPVGLKKEKEWKRSPSLSQAETTWNKMFKDTTNSWEKLFKDTSHPLA